ncbi:MAG: MFS transporter [Nanoarchaeota archaeon]|nr:MFS transporter [Nanoarchaeota archaeon]
MGWPKTNKRGMVDIGISGDELGLDIGNIGLPQVLATIIILMVVIALGGIFQGMEWIFSWITLILAIALSKILFGELKFLGLIAPFVVMGNLMLPGGGAAGAILEGSNMIIAILANVPTIILMLISYITAKDSGESEGNAGKAIYIIVLFLFIIRLIGFIFSIDLIQGFFNLMIFNMWSPSQAIAGVPPLGPEGGPFYNILSYLIKAGLLIGVFLMVDYPAKSISPEIFNYTWMLGVTFIFFYAIIWMPFLVTNPVIRSSFGVMAGASRGMSENLANSFNTILMPLTNPEAYELQQQASFRSGGSLIGNIGSAPPNTGFTVTSVQLLPDRINLFTNRTSAVIEIKNDGDADIKEMNVTFTGEILPGGVEGQKVLFDCKGRGRTTGYNITETVWKWDDYLRVTDIPKGTSARINCETIEVIGVLEGDAVNIVAEATTEYYTRTLYSITVIESKYAKEKMEQGLMQFSNPKTTVSYGTVLSSQSIGTQPVFDTTGTSIFTWGIVNAGSGYVNQVNKIYLSVPQELSDPTRINDQTYCTTDGMTLNEDRTRCEGACAPGFYELNAQQLYDVGWDLLSIDKPCGYYACRAGQENYCTGGSETWCCKNSYLDDAGALNTVVCAESYDTGCKEAGSGIVRQENKYDAYEVPDTCPPSLRTSVGGWFLCQRFSEEPVSTKEFQCYNQTANTEDQLLVITGLLDKVEDEYLTESLDALSKLGYVVCESQLPSVEEGSLYRFPIYVNPLKAEKEKTFLIRGDVFYTYTKKGSAQGTVVKQ